MENKKITSDLKDYFKTSANELNKEKELQPLPEKDKPLNQNKDEKSPQPKKSNIDKKYRNFTTGKTINKWKIEFPWLVYKDEKLFCKICMECKNNCNLSLGLLKFKKDMLVRHGMSAIHKSSISWKKNKHIESSLVITNKKHESEIIKRMRNIYYLAKQGCSITQCPNLHDLIDIQLERDTLDKYYKSVTTGWRMVEVISDVLEKEHINNIKSSPFISLAADESTDISFSKNLILYCKYLENNSPKTVYLKLMKVENGSSATIYNAIKDYLHKNKFELNNIVGWASDGASTMMGNNNGVQTRLKEIAPCLVSIHDPGHREALAVKESYSSIPFLDENVDGTIKNINLFFCKSTVRQNELKELQEEFDDSSLKMKRLYDIRWLSRNIAMDTIRRSLPSLMRLFCHNEKDPLAISIYKHLSSYKFLLVFHSINDITNTVSILSEYLQKTDLHPYFIVPKVISVINNLKNNYANDNCNPLKGSIHGMDLQNKFESHPICFNECIVQYEPDDEEFASNIIKMFAKNLIKNLHDRFPDTDLFKNWIILDPKKYPKMSNDIASFGIDEVKNIFKFYTTNGTFKWNLETLLSEYQLLKQYIYSECTTMNIVQVGVHILDNLEEIYPNMAQLVRIFLILPATSVDCERGFSQQNLIKTRVRNRLELDHLDDLMRIKLNGPSIKNFDFSKASKIFNMKYSPCFNKSKN